MIYFFTLTALFYIYKEVTNSILGNSKSQCTVVYSVVGTPFYLMEHVKGRVFTDVTLTDLTLEERRLAYEAMCDVLTRIHKVDIKKAHLENYGKMGKCRLLDCGFYVPRIMDNDSAWKCG